MVLVSSWGCVLLSMVSSNFSKLRRAFYRVECLTNVVIRMTVPLTASNSRMYSCKRPRRTSTKIVNLERADSVRFIKVHYSILLWP